MNRMIERKIKRKGMEVKIIARFGEKVKKIMKR